MNTFDKDEARKIFLNRYPSYKRVIKIDGRTIRQYKILTNKLSIAVRKWKIKYPLKSVANKKVFSALRNKTLFKQPCIKCGNILSEAHHEDYTKPLEVTWLCKKHHVEADIQRRLALE